MDIERFGNEAAHETHKDTDNFGFVTVLSKSSAF
jgi:hypothetical protein